MALSIFKDGYNVIQYHHIYPVFRELNREGYLYMLKYFRTYFMY